MAWRATAATLQPYFHIEMTLGCIAKASSCGWALYQPKGKGSLGEGLLRGTAWARKRFIQGSTIRASHADRNDEHISDPGDLSNIRGIRAGSIDDFSFPHTQETRDS